MRISVLVALVLLTAAPGAGAAEMFFTATIDSAQESNPGIPLPGRASGFATFHLNAAMDAFTYDATIVGLDVTGMQTPGDMTDNLTAAHIHAPGLLGVNAGVVFGFFGAPFNDNMPNDFVLTPFATGVGGRFQGKWDLPEGNGTNLALQLNNIVAGLSYINFHTVAFGGGEIRGQIQGLIPEPGTLTLFGLGAAGLALFAWRKRRAQAA